MMGTLRALAVALALVALAGPAHAGLPSDAVREGVDRALQVLDDSGLKGAAHAAARREQVREIANRLFDFEEMARRALAVHWNARTPMERQQFVVLFADLFESTYFAKIDIYGGAGGVRYGAEKVEGDDATVRTTIVTPKGSEASVDYRLLHRDGRWRVWDVAVEGMSLVSSYRAQFNQIIRASSYQDLVQRLARVGAPKTVGPGS